MNRNNSDRKMEQGEDKHGIKEQIEKKKTRQKNRSINI